jgi:Ca2+-binding EF-hand superfamily protein
VIVSEKDTTVQLTRSSAMKPSSVTPALLAAILFLVPALRAEDGAAPEADGAPAGRAMNAERHAEMLKRFDKNGDGKLDETEKTAAKEYNRTQQTEGGKKAGERLRKKAVAKYDKNGDGKLDQAEKEAARAEIVNDPKVIKRHDKNGDGKLDEAEQAAARETILNGFEKRAGKKKD